MFSVLPRLTIIDAVLLSSSASVEDGNEGSFDGRLDDITDDSGGSRDGSDKRSDDDEGSDRELFEDRRSSCSSHREHPTVEEHTNQKEEDDEEERKRKQLELGLKMELINPPWASDPGLGTGPIVPLSEEENQFFKVWQYKMILSTQKLLSHRLA